MTRIILNADDFGITPGVNQSILDLRRRGVLTSATLMATAGRTDEAAFGAIDSGLGVGCHVVLVDGQPALPFQRVPALAPKGAFRPTLGNFVADLVRGHIPQAEIESEAVAQIRRLQHAGVHLTHVDTHKHTHMFARVLRPLICAALQCGIRAIRNPFEPEWAIHATPHAPALRRMQVRALRTQRRAFLRLVRDAGLASTDGAIGVVATGTLDTPTIKSLLEAMPAGTWELVCHPGHLDSSLNDVHTRLKESRAVEHAALLETVPAFLSSHPEVIPIHFGQLAGDTK
ncbi:MAG: ChbG/HpnK family deacetylase [Acidobacteriaceae bacterium]